MRTSARRCVCTYVRSAYVRACVGTYTCVHVCRPYVCTHVCTYVRVCVCTRIRVCLLTGLYMYECAHVLMRLRTLFLVRINAYAFELLCAYVYTDA